MKSKCPICGKRLKYLSVHLVERHGMSKDSKLVKEASRREYERDKRANAKSEREKRINNYLKTLRNPPHWYFPVSYREIVRRKMKNIEKALEKIGLTFEDLDKIKPKTKSKRR